MNLSKLILFFYNHKLYKEIRTSEKFQYLKPEDIRKYQENKLKKIIEHSKKNVPYYKYKLDEFETINDLWKIAFLEKKSIIGNEDLLCAKNLPKKRFLKNSTSGSTGDSLNFYSDRENYCRKAAVVRGNSWAGLKYGRRQLHFWGAERDIDKRKSIYKKLKHRYVTPNKMLSTYHLSEDDIKEYIEIYNKYKPDVIVSYPSPLMHISDYIRSQDLNVWSPSGIILSSETTYDFQRKNIEKTFKSRVYNRYGSREFGHIAAECTHHRGLHYNSDRFVLEVVDEKGNLCKPGELGEIVITDLDNYVFPLIRYKIGDLGILTDKQCTCGIKLPLLEKVEGRTFDLVIGTNGNIVAGSFWTLLRNEVKGWEKFQIIQENLGELKVIVEENPRMRVDFENEVGRHIKEKLGEDMVIKVNRVNQIGLTRSGKFKWIVSKVSPYVS